MDCGITGVEEVDYAPALWAWMWSSPTTTSARRRLPQAAAVVDPHRPDCPYPFKRLAGVRRGAEAGAWLWAGRTGTEALFSRSTATLAAVGTVADVMQMSGENRTIVSRGLAAIDHSYFIGLHALLKEAGLAGQEITSVQIGFVLAPRINAAGRMGAADKAAELLLCTDPAEAERMARELCALNRERQNVEQTIYSQAEEMIAHLPDRRPQRAGAGEQPLASGRGGHRGLPPFREVSPAPAL